jgi:hypothetical protein
MSSSKSQKSKQLSLTFSFSDETSDYGAKPHTPPNTKPNVEVAQSVETIYLKSLLTEIVTQKQHIAHLTSQIKALRNQNRLLLGQNFHFLDLNRDQQPVTSPISPNPNPGPNPSAFIPAPVPTPIMRSEPHFSTLLLSHLIQNSRNEDGGLPPARPLIFSQWGSKRSWPALQPTTPKPMDSPTKPIGAILPPMEQALENTKTEKNAWSEELRKVKKPRPD